MNAPSLNDQGIAAARSGDYRQAAAMFERAVAVAPDHAGARFNLAQARMRLGDVTAAEAAACSAVCLAPEDADNHYLLAQALAAQGRWIEAVVSCQHAHRLAPTRAEFLGTLIEGLNGLGRVAEALAARERLAVLQPRDAAGFNELGHLLQRMGRVEEAERAYARASEVDPNFAVAFANRAQVKANLGQVDEARALYARANSIRPTPQSLIAEAVTLPVVYDSVEHARRERQRIVAAVDDLVARGVQLDPTRVVLPNTFYLAYQGENDRSVMERFSRLLVPVQHRATRLPDPNGSGQKRIRLGVLSKHLCDHTIGWLNLRLIEALPRDEFEIVLFRPNASDDAVAQRFVAAADRDVKLPEDLATAISALATARLDALFLPDVGMDPFTLTLAANRFAPTQFCTWGHPDTTGLPTIDAFLSIADELPEADLHYTERLIRMPVLGAGLERPPSPAPSRRSNLGLPERARLYGCPQSLFKLHPDFDAVLAGVLERDPDSKLVLLEGNQPLWTEKTRARFARNASPLGNPDRVVWMKRLPREGYRQMIAHCDVLLDPLHFGGGHTSYEAFAFGVPLVSLPAPYLRGRLTWSMIRRLGLEADLAATTPSDLVERAVTLANDRDRREEVRQKILATADRLFDLRPAAEAFVGAVREMTGVAG